MFDVRKNLAQVSETVLKKKFSVDRPVSFDIPREESRGDLSSSIALQLSKQLGKSPRDIATAIGSELKKIDGIETVEVAGPGYINIQLKPQVLVDALRHAIDACMPTKTRKEPPVIIEYSQPNIAKPLGIHHILSTVIGQCIANLYQHAGYPVISWNYMGDWGTQFGKLAVAHKRWGRKKDITKYSLDDLLKLYVTFHTKAEKDGSLESEARETFLKLEQGDSELRQFWSDVVRITKASLATVYERMHVKFDTDLGESFYEDKMQPVIDEGMKKGVFTVGEGGALIVTFPEDTKLPPYMIRKSDGATLYSTRDLAQMKYRLDSFKPQTILIITDIAQKLHFEQLVESCRMLGWTLPEFENVLFGRMQFADKAMSTRKGNILKLEDVLDEAVSRAAGVIKEKGSELDKKEKESLSEMIGIGSVVYGVLSQNRRMNMIFDWNKFLSFEGNSAPYLQYTHARALSILRKAEVKNVKFPAYKGKLSDAERNLIRHLVSFSEILAAARTERMPHRLTNFLYELCQAFNAFYNAEVILKASETERALRLALTFTTATILKTGAEILTLRVPDRM